MGMEPRPLKMRNESRSCNADVAGSIPVGSSDAVIAQQAERCSRKAQVAGSIPADSFSCLRSSIGGASLS